MSTVPVNKRVEKKPPPLPSSSPSHSNLANHSYKLSASLKRTTLIIAVAPDSSALLLPKFSPVDLRMIKRSFSGFRNSISSWELGGPAWCTRFGGADTFVERWGCKYEEDKEDLRFGVQEFSSKSLEEDAESIY
ncbi:hypothetical protein PM082_004069 [Marasmius tenuissimus]|nr:hypothetical protein PM082_004069 [Marasmius tenuissimus]